MLFKSPLPGARFAATALLSLALAGTAVAQDTAAPADPQVTDPALRAAPAEGDVPNLAIETFADWELRCDTASDTCFMYQLVRDENANPVAEINILDLPDGGEASLGATVITPLGTLLNQGLVIQVDEGQGRRYEYNWCTRAGCFVRFGLADTDVAAMRAGALARMRIVSASAPTTPLILTMSLSGFTAASNALQGR